MDLIPLPQWVSCRGSWILDGMPTSHHWLCDSVWWLSHLWLCQWRWYTHLLRQYTMLASPEWDKTIFNATFYKSGITNHATELIEFYLTLPQNDAEFSTQTQAFHHWTAFHKLEVKLLKTYYIYYYNNILLLLLYYTVKVLLHEQLMSVRKWKNKTKQKTTITKRPKQFFFFKVLTTCYNHTLSLNESDVSLCILHIDHLLFCGCFFEHRRTSLLFIFEPVLRSVVSPCWPNFRLLSSRFGSRNNSLQMIAI